MTPEIEMSEIDQGGFVYPFEGGVNNYMSPCRGITLRQHYASAVLPQLLAEYFVGARLGEFGVNPDWKNGIAMDAFKIADAMIEADKL